MTAAETFQLAAVVGSPPSWVPSQGGTQGEPTPTYRRSREGGQALPLPKPETGRYHLVRFIRSDRRLDVFGEQFLLPPEAQYAYVVATVEVARQRLSVTLDGEVITTCRTSSGEPRRMACGIRVNDVVAQVRVIEVMALVN